MELRGLLLPKVREEVRREEGVRGQDTWVPTRPRLSLPILDFSGPIFWSGKWAEPPIPCLGPGLEVSSLSILRGDSPGKQFAVLATHSPGPASREGNPHLAERSAVAILKFSIFEQGALHFHFYWSPQIT